jgi:hypothetical protein
MAPPNGNAKSFLNKHLHIGIHLRVPAKARMTAFGGTRFFKCRYLTTMLENYCPFAQPRVNIQSDMCNVELIVSCSVVWCRERFLWWMGIPAYVFQLHGLVVMILELPLH